MQTPDNYYQQVLDIEKSRQKTQDKEGQKPEILANEPLLKEKPIPNDYDEFPLTDIEETPVIKKDEVYKETESPRRETIVQPPAPMPIAVAPELIRIALSSAGLEINVRNLELVNGRLTGGKNSVRINFLSDSIDTTDSKFVAICAVLYHLDRETKTIDVIVGMAEDDKSDLLAIYQSDMSDVTDWMNNKLSPGEWRSRITKKVM